MPRESTPEPSRSAAGYRTALALFLLVAAVYILSSPGRIDSIDGQIRFDVTLSLLSTGKPVLRDPAVVRFGVAGLEGVYSGYGPAASYAALPLVWLGGLSDDPFGETRRFLFAMVGPLLGAAMAPVLFFFYRNLGVSRGQAVLWSLVSAFASMLWPAATTVLDQIQHAFLVVLAVFSGHLASRRDSPWLAAAAGLAAGLLITYQEPYLLLAPLLGLSTLDGAATRDRKKARYLLFLAAAGIGVAFWMSYNLTRFGNPFDSGKIVLDSGHPGPLGNPLWGLAGLLVSPGKSIFLYSPTLALGLVGFAKLRRRRPWLGTTVVAVSAVHLLLVASLSFFHGDWCWGPRYLVVLLPLWALAFPFAVGVARRRVAAGLVVAAVLVQLLGLAVVHERFFFERGLPTFFWAGDPAFYFRQSALVARPAEIWSSLLKGVPASAEEFSPTPYPRLLTYFIAGFPPRQAPTQMQRFKVFYLPRPWPLWLPRVDSDEHDLPVDPVVAPVLVVGVGLFGLGLLIREGRRD